MGRKIGSVLFFIWGTLRGALQLIHMTILSMIYYE